jgi:hypothetical protein
MADQWYFLRDKTRLGPFSSAQLKDLAAQGKLRPSDTVWKEGIDRGVAAERVKNLFPAPPAEAVVPPSPSASASVANKPAKLEPWLGSTKDSVTPEEQQESIPDELTLKEIDENDSTAPTSRVKGAADAKIQDGAGVASCPPIPSPPKKKGRAVGAKGAVLVSQDGQIVQYRKKCLKCGHDDPVKNTMPIRNGVTRSSFFCPKCRKAGAVEIHCVS